MTRKILHVDLDAFFCAVEEQQDPSLAGQPFAVGGRPNERGVVSSCSYAARLNGVRSAMPMARAVRLCPSLRIVSPRHHLYSEVSERVMAILHGLTPLVEQVSIDEAFLDVSDLPEPGEKIGQQLQVQINKELKLPCSLGIASNKLLAKIANDAGKSFAGKSTQKHGQPPNAITVVPPGQEADFLCPLPVNALWGVGPKTTVRMEEMGIHTIGDLAAWPESDLVQRFGKSGKDLSRCAKGLDDSPVMASHEVKSISQEITFAKDISDPLQLQHTLRELSEGVGKHLRKEALYGTTVKLKLRWPDFTTITRQITLDTPTDQDSLIFVTVLKLFENVWQKGKAVRLIGVGISGLCPPVRQLGLWDDSIEPRGQKDRQLQATLDALRERFGDNVIQRASDLKHSS